MSAIPLITEGRDLFRRIISLPDEAKNRPAPPELQAQFKQWRRRLLEAHPLRTPAVRDTAEAYVARLTPRLLAYYLETLMRDAGHDHG